MSVVLAGVAPGLAARLADVFPDATRVEDARDVPEGVAPVDLVVQELRHSGEPGDSLDRATYGTWRVLRELAPRRHLVLSSLAMFRSYDPGWAVTEHWHARPTDDPEELVPYLGELTVRELARVAPVDAAILRLRSPAGRLADDELAELVALAAAPGGAAGLRVRHVASRQPARTTRPAMPERPGPLHLPAPPASAVLLGAGGPLGAAATTAAAGVLPLVLSDVVPLSRRADAPPQTPGAPVPVPVVPPNSEALVDVGDAAAVAALTAGAECVVNCTVVRGDARGAFRVNVLGAYAVMRAAVEHGIPRVVHTGPAFVVAPHPYGYADDRGIGGPVPPRAGDDIYLLTKLLAMEVCRIVAERHRIACPALLFIQMTDPLVGREEQAHPFIVSWADAGRAIVAAARLPELPEPFTVLHVTAESPHDRFAAGRAWEVLGIEPRDRLDHLWYHDAPKAGTT